ncbi:DUF885 family protein [Pedobacter sp. MR2016-24]|uniref:DUF885 family protein n=1 Tax=Pedobacter sp. MR2016-24 TaxID=2994466 RepID=UPI0022467383|nr:DUF885 family protein [Pedobacter sp. MR2016-24]MCX2486351.1 DUF885 family protein [Pedobacter sp. MR2016-24]
MKQTAILFTVFSLLTSLAGESRAQSANEQQLLTQTSETADIMINYKQDIDAIKRFYTPYGAESGYGWRNVVTQSSPEQMKRLKEVNELYLEKLDKKDFNGISIYGKVDAILLKRDITAALGSLAAEEKEYQQISQYIPFAEEIYQLEKGRRRGLSVDGQQVAALYAKLLKEIDAANVKLEKQANIDMKLAERLKKSIEGLGLRLKSVYNFYYGYDPLFTWWIEQPQKVLAARLEQYALAAVKKGEVKTTQKADNSGIVGVPIGREEFIRQLKTEMISYTPEELLDIANKEFEWCDREMLKASKEMGFGTDWKKALEKVKNSYVPVGKQPEMILGLYNRSVDFVKSKDMITLPPLAEETWGMIMMTPERQLVNPFFTGGREISISYPTNTMAHQDKLMSMRGNNPNFSFPTVQHELLPGHNLQYFMNSRSKAYRDGFETPFWTEGWSLYWEMLLYDKGFAVTPEEKVGMLFWRMHRCARIIFSANYHLGKWTPQEAIDFLVDRVGHERANAEGEVRRSFTGGYGPLYQIAYLIGGLQFYALEREMVESGKMTLKAYHDKVMQENNIPVEMVRAILTNQNLNINYQTNWKFYNQTPAKK